MNKTTASGPIDRLAQLYEEDALLSSALAGLRPGGEALLKYGCAADYVGRQDMMISELTSRVEAAVELGTVTGIALCYRDLPIVAHGPGPKVEIPIIRKHMGRIKKEHPHSFSQAVPYPSLSEGLVIKVAVVSLVLGVATEAAPRISTVGPDPAGSLPPDEWMPEPRPEHVAHMMERFRLSPAEIRKASVNEARARDPGSWSANRTQASLLIGQIDLLSPIKKVFVASGLGLEILEHALTGPESRARRVGKDGCDRDTLLNAMWRHALDRQGAPPPFVKL